MSHQHNHDDLTNLKVAFFLNIGFTILEIIGGILINSVAILSDALHDLGDSLSLGMAWYLQRYSQKDSDLQYTYGYRRFSLLGALVNAIVLVGGSLYIFTEAIPRLLEPESFHAPGMIGFAVVGVLVNGLAAYRLQDTQSSNAQVVGWHLLEDVLGWLSVLIVGIIALFVDLPILDPLLSLGITAYILINVATRLKNTAQLFLQAVPHDIDLESLKHQLDTLDGVRSRHHTHAWSLDGDHNVFTTHLIVDDDVTAKQVMSIRQTVQSLIQDRNFEHITIAIEYEREDCAMR